MSNPRNALSAPPCALLPTPNEPDGTFSLVVPTGGIDLGFAVLVGVAEVWSCVQSAN